MSVETFSSRRPLIVEAFRRHGGHLTVAELAVPDVGGQWWRQELHAMRDMRYDLHEDPITGDWHLVGDPKIAEPAAPAGFHFTTALRAMTARGRDLDQRKDPERACDPQIGAGCELSTGHELEVSPGVGLNRCVHCKRPWNNCLRARACVRRPAPLRIVEREKAAA